MCAHDRSSVARRRMACARLLLRGVQLRSDLSMPKCRWTAGWPVQRRRVLRHALLARSRGALGRCRSRRLDGRDVLRYFDSVQPSTKWEVVLYVDERGDDTQRAALAQIFLGRAGGTVAELYGPAIGDVHVVRPARITVEHVAPRKRIDVVGYV